MSKLSKRLLNFSTRHARSVCLELSLNAALCAFTMAMMGFFIVHQPACWAQEDPSAHRAELIEQGFLPLFDGESLAEWDVKEGHRGHWVVRNGIIDYDGKATGETFDDRSLWTKEAYSDFVLYAEWRLPAEPTMKPHPVVLTNGDFALDEKGERKTVMRLDAGDSGILLRGTTRCQANIWSQNLGSGEINAYRKDQSLPDGLRKKYIPSKRADRPFGEWNRFLITMREDRITVVLNGEKVIDEARLPGVPRRGPIGLQHHGDPIQFRNLWIKPAQSEFEDFLAGKTLAEDFEVYWDGGATWSLKNGVLRGENPSRISWIFTKQSYSDFILTLDFRLSKGGNGGVCIRFPWPESGDTSQGPAFLGYECQITETGEANATGSIYELARASGNRPIHRPGAWNHYRIYAKGDHLVTYVNGRKTAETHADRSYSGRLGFQVHEPAEWIEYRNLKLKLIR